MTDPNEMAQALSDLVRVFGEMTVIWAVGGSVASTTYGDPRSTNDIDIVAVMSEMQARDFAARLGSHYYVDADAAAEAAKRHASFNVIDNRTFIKIDVFIPAAGPLGAGQLDRRAEFDAFPGLPRVPVLSPEDTILQKLQWFRLGGEVSDRQWRDILSVMRNVKPLDDTYLDSVASTGGLRALLERARREAA